MGIAGLLAEDKAAPVFSDDFSGNSGGDLQEGLTADPEPGKTTARTRRKATMKAAPAPRASVPVSRSVAVKELSEELQVYGGMAALTISMRGDEVCAAVVSQQSKAIADATAVLIARSERMLSIMHGGGLLADLVRLAQALLPVVKVVRSHHARRGEEPTSDGADALAGFPAFAPGRPYQGAPASA